MALGLGLTPPPVQFLTRHPTRTILCARRRRAPPAATQPPRLFRQHMQADTQDQLPVQSEAAGQTGLASNTTLPRRRESSGSGTAVSS